MITFMWVLSMYSTQGIHSYVDTVYIQESSCDIMKNKFQSNSEKDIKWICEAIPLIK
jgi:hypothetical protein